MKDANKLGTLWKRSETLKVWEKKYAILSKGYIYFLDNNKDEKASSYNWVKKSVITEID
jgi:hypothetical protein